MWENRKGVTTLKLIRRKDLLEVSESARVLSSIFQVKSNTDGFLNLRSYKFSGCENLAACTDIYSQSFLKTVNLQEPFLYFLIIILD